MNPLFEHHPERLLWYADGRLDPEASAEVERHLAECEACRDELRTMRSMFRSLHEAHAEDHVSCADLVVFHDRHESAGSPDGEHTAAHLKSCGRCRAELDRLRAAAAFDHRVRDERISIAEPVRVFQAEIPRAAPWSARWGYPFLTAAAMVLIVLTLPSRSITSKATFEPTLRGPEATRRLDGLGPWEIDVVLPTQAPTADYTARVRSTDPSVGVLAEATALAGPEAPIQVTVHGFPAPGHYLLELDASGAGGRRGYSYPFDVVRSP